jgi:chromosome partitioning protein
MKHYRIKQIMNLLGSTVRRESIVQAEESGAIPTASRQANGSIRTRVWSTDQIPAIGERYGFLPKLDGPTVLTVFTTKGGVLKTTCALNVARLAALHNIRTLVIGLDLQCDITSALGFYNWDDVSELQTALDAVEATDGLYSVSRGNIDLDQVIQPTDIPTLSLIPETAELATLDRWISTQPRREYWLKEQIVDPLRDRFDLIIFDCSPNWSQLITNAIVACDIMLSPIECHINQFRNLNVFRDLADEFKMLLKLDYEHIFVPTRFASVRKLSNEIRGWYLANVDGVTHSVIRESVQGEEAMASHISVPEYAATTLPASEMRELMKELWYRIEHRNDSKRAVA